MPVMGYFLQGLISMGLSLSASPLRLSVPSSSIICDIMYLMTPNMRHPGSEVCCLCIICKCQACSRPGSIDPSWVDGRTWTSTLADWAIDRPMRCTLIARSSDLASFELQVLLQGNPESGVPHKLILVF